MSHQMYERQVFKSLAWIEREYVHGYIFTTDKVNINEHHSSSKLKHPSAEESKSDTDKRVAPFVFTIREDLN